MLVPADALQTLLQLLDGHPVVAAKSLCLAPVEGARLLDASGGTLLWVWDEWPRPPFLVASLAYHDRDGAIVGMSLLAPDRTVSEIDLWRGDEQPIQSVPAHRDQIWEMVVGQVYGPRT